MDGNEQLAGVKRSWAGSCMYCMFYFGLLAWFNRVFADLLLTYFCTEAFMQTT
jgi:hypothetical protein